ncbi:hypothetical protein [Thermococcus sp.]|uniref:hypothetical protein n=2 Tax=Thermococcus sp. TaxID=35749 RepID=UPI0025F0D09E|nr:hypothetical protein [Thermococcus sp.]
MSRMVKSTGFFTLLLFLLIGPIPAWGMEDGLKILDAYSTGDRIAFLVFNEASDELYSVVYDGHSFEAERLNFTLGHYQVRHWNGEYWLLQKGERGTVGLYTYRKGRLRLIKTFSRGSLCTDNDLEVKWNGKEYFLTFIMQGSNDDPSTGECDFIFKNYLLEDENLIPLNVSGPAIWIPALNAWLVEGSLAYLVDENGKLLDEYNFSRTGIYSVGLVINDSKNLVTVSADGGWVKLFAVRDSSLVLIHNRRLEERELGEGPYPPEVWIGKPVLFDGDPRNDSVSIIWLFNGTDFVKIHTFKGYTTLYPVMASNRSYLLSRVPANGGTRILLNLFELKGFSLVQLGSLKARNNYLRVVNTGELKGFPALKVESRSMLVAPGGDSVFLFNSTDMFELTSGNSIELPNALRNNNYRVSFCCGGVVVFNENRAYLFKNGKFRDITPEILSVLSRNSENSMSLASLTLVTLAVMVIVLLVFLRKRR